MHCNSPFIFTTVIISCLSIIFHKPINRYIYILKCQCIEFSILKYSRCSCNCYRTYLVSLGVNIIDRKALASHEFKPFFSYISKPCVCNPCIQCIQFLISTLVISLSLALLTWRMCQMNILPWHDGKPF